ncbi:low specificity L-threonine aldolase [Streptacidiphilus sp. P02-A3a]|uniref:threonine aldolase family protein n=1 Tax=Streptacidiphilus sp. P02-A3a TaxID=2704468 RepID=UPI0015FCC882|nr:beta-eliminating lyase-related protein [Streptacidiphilus sp. P02-A3a]QMU73002.1 threonine aldolase [Streptacidiphilus sp. P02-A3a]
MAHHEQGQRQDEQSAADPAERRFAAIRGCERVLSAARTTTLRERLADLAAGAEQAYDLDQRPDVYGNGVVEALEERVAGLLGTDSAAFFPTGTMAQQVALRCWADRTGDRTVAMHPLSHLELHERFAYSQLTGLRSVWPTRQPRLPSADEVAEFAEPFGTLLLELPLREAGFVLPTWEELRETVAAARARDAVVHLDGARLWETVPHFGRSLPEIAELADSVYVSFYKSLGGLSGAALAGPEEFTAQAKHWRHRYGGQLFEQWPAALSALAGLDRELPRLAEYVGHAKTVAAAIAGALAAVPGARVYPEPPHTHQFQVWLPFPADALNAAGLRQAEQTREAVFGMWREPGLPGVSYTEVTVAADALAWTPADVRAGVAAFLERIG